MTVHAVIPTGQVTHSTVLKLGIYDLALFMGALCLTRNVADDRRAMKLGLESSLEVAGAYNWCECLLRFPASVDDIKSPNTSLPLPACTCDTMKTTQDVLVGTC